MLYFNTNVGATLDPLAVPSCPNQVWGADFMSDRLYDRTRDREHEGRVGLSADGVQGAGGLPTIPAGRGVPLCPGAWVWQSPWIRKDPV